ncbi:hypothetical protein BG011_002883 [Mortierella polycephala]|uniref:F-box domain-containing protein n=1 Tax=Mortierella polycephala TaxID=41804 RepID=A0A9P6Q4V5_9FUNG|nr:hypothetical protein BG011_002883 [Mortierella polycephala]
MDSLPLETFQLICSFCPLHVLASLRLVSKDFCDRVDGSLTARRMHAVPTKTVTTKDKHDHNACYIRLALNRQHEPIVAAFNRYSIRHNYLEFVQRTAPSAIDGSVFPGSSPSSTAAASIPTGSITYRDFTLGRLDLNLWEQQRETKLKPDNNATAGDGRRARRSSIGQIASSAQAVTFSGSSSSSTMHGSNTSQATTFGQSDHYMTRFARMILGASGSGQAHAQTRAGMTTAQLVEEARQLIHTFDPEILSSRKQYKFHLTEGTHYIGDNDFIMRYTITGAAPSPSSESLTATEVGVLNGPDVLALNRSSGSLFKVDYIRVSWRWITSGTSPKAQTETRDLRLSEQLKDPIAQEDPFPELRVGRIYADRYNRVLTAIAVQGVSHHVRGELALIGYDASVLARDFISVDLCSEPVLAWITRDGQDEERRTKKNRATRSLVKMEVLLGHRSEDLLKVPSEQEGGCESDSDWEDLGPGDKVETLADQDKDATEPEMDDGDHDDEMDQEALDELLQSMKDNLGFLTARNVLEEMLATRGYKRALIWKYGVVRREMMGSVPDLQHANQLLQKIIDSETASRIHGHGVHAGSGSGSHRQ